jgi:hypothetical protein
MKMIGVLVWLRSTTFAADYCLLMLPYSWWPAVRFAQAIAACGSPEEAARLGRCSERRQPHLVRPDWPQAKLEVMLAALRAKFAAHAGPRQMLLATASGREAEAPLQVHHTA